MTTEECDLAQQSVGINGYNGGFHETSEQRYPWCWVGTGGNANFNQFGDQGSQAAGSSLICKKPGGTLTKESHDLTPNASVLVFFFPTFFLRTNFVFHL